MRVLLEQSVSVRAVPELMMGEAGAAVRQSLVPVPDNVKMYSCKYAKFDQNIPCGSRVMSIFTNRPRPV